MVNVLITGREGFIGRHLCEHLLSTRNFVIANDNGDRPDVTNTNKIETYLGNGKEVIIHLAAKSSVTESFKDPYTTFYTNTVGTLNLLEIARLSDIRKFIFVSTYVYGQAKYLPVDERHPVNPHSPYHQSKLIAEQLCENYSNDYGIDIVSLRPFHVYGPGSKPYSFVSAMIRQIKENGRVILSGENTKRDFLFIDDFTSLIESILYKFPRGYNLYNVGSGRSYTLYVVTQILAKLLKKEIIVEYDPKMRPNDILEVVADISKVSNKFSWKPFTSLEKGLQLSVYSSGY